MSVDGEKEYLQKLPSKRRKKKYRIARADLIVSIPLVLVLNRIGVQVPLAVVSVPVRIHCPEYYAHRAIHATTL